MESPRKYRSFSRYNVVEQAEQFLGMPYQKDGKHPSTGFDCSGFVAYVFNYYGQQLKGGSKDIAQKGITKSLVDLEIGDLVFFGEHHKITHVGIVSAKNHQGIEMIHSSSSNGITREMLNHSPYWQKKFLFGKDLINLNAKLN